MQFLSLTPLFLAFLSQSFKIHFVAVHLFSLPVLHASSVAAIPSPLNPLRLLRSKIQGVCRCLCYARLLSRSGCGLVTVFENPTYVQCSFRTSSHTALLSLILMQILLVKSVHAVHSVPTLPAFHTLVSISLFVIQKLRQALVHTA